MGGETAGLNQSIYLRPQEEARAEELGILPRERKELYPSYSRPLRGEHQENQSMRIGGERNEEPVKAPEIQRGAKQAPPERSARRKEGALQLLLQRNQPEVVFPSDDHERATSLLLSRETTKLSITLTSDQSRRCRDEVELTGAIT